MAAVSMTPQPIGGMKKRRGTMGVRLRATFSQAAATFITIAKCC